MGFLPDLKLVLRTTSLNIKVELPRKSSFLLTPCCYPAPWGLHPSIPTAWSCRLSNAFGAPSFANGRARLGEESAGGLGCSASCILHASSRLLIGRLESSAVANQYGCINVSTQHPQTCQCEHEHCSAAQVACFGSISKAEI